MTIDVKTLKEWLNMCNDTDEIIIEYECNDDWYNYYGAIQDIDYEDKTLIFRIY